MENLTASQIAVLEAHAETLEDMAATLVADLGIDHPTTLAVEEAAFQMRLRTGDRGVLYAYADEPRFAERASAALGI